ncbi:MAG: ferritin-like domain-containing protein [Haloglomus sp.]
MTGSTPSQATGSIETIIERIQSSSLASRRDFLRRSAAAGAGALALSVAGSNTALAHDASADDTSDIDVLNYALTLEHLENAFYRMGREEFDRDDFMSARSLEGFGSRVRGNVRENLRDIGAHEQTHVDTLSSVIEGLGGDPVTEGCYDFGVDDADEFIAVAGVLENTGVSAYDGAIDLVGNADLLTAGATIATVEARHASYLNLLNGEDPFPAAFDDPKSMQEVLDAAGGFIVECTD